MNILVVDDEKEIAGLVEIYLKNENYKVDVCYTGTQALQNIRTRSYDLAILDVMLPDMDGFSICRTIRQNYTWPIIMLTAKEQDIDKINGLMIGADDYMTKPFSLMVLVSKVQALMKRVVRNQGQELISGELSVSLNEMKVKLQGELLPLSKTEIQLLVLFMENPKQILSTDQLLDQIWDTKGEYVDTNTVSVNISRLQQKIGKERIKTVRGVGYLWINDVQKK